VAEEQDFLLIFNRAEARQFHAHLFASLLYLRLRDVQRLAGTPLLETVKAIESSLMTMLSQRQPVIILLVTEHERRMIWQVFTLLWQCYRHEQPTEANQSTLENLSICRQLLQYATPI
jgi:hypothetical protein